MEEIWSTQERHLSCIQDLPGVQLYTETGRLPRAGSACQFIAVREAPPLWSPSTSTSSRLSQAFLIDGLVRWNEDRAAAAAPPAAAEEHLSPLHSYSGHLKHALTRRAKGCLVFRWLRISPNLLRTQGSSSGWSTCTSRRAACLRMSAWTLMLRTRLLIISSDAAARSGDPAGTIRSGSHPSPTTTTEEDVRPGTTQNSGQHPSSDSEEEVQGPDGQSGYQYVLKLAKVLVEIRSLPAIFNSRVDRIITLWKRLPDCDKQRVVYPAGIGTDSPKGASRPQRGITLPVLGRRVSNGTIGF
ncbi:uncharacterized protein LOC144995125 isoform X2 [Oryzias latipes]